MSLERHDIQEENVGAYLLGALTEFEERAFVLHLDECPVCSDEVARLRPAADALPRSVTQITPPPALKASLMTIVEAEAREARGSARSPVDRGSARQRVAQGPARSRGGDTRTRRPAAFRRRMGAVGGAFASMRPAAAWVSASFLLFVGILSGYAATQLTTSEDEPARALVAMVDKQRIPFGTGSLTVSGEGAKKSGILRVHGMPTLENDSIYQVWVKRDGEVMSASLFSVGQDGDGAAAVSERLDGADAVLVTRERAGGARAPSEEPVLSVSL